MARMIAAIDIGTTKICTLVAEVGEMEAVPPRIIGVGVAPSRGLRKGMIINARETTEAIVSSLQKAERVSGYQITQACVGVAGGHINSFNKRGVAVCRGERGITQEDVFRALEAARADASLHDQRILHIIPRTYSIDGQKGIREPVGMHGFRLEVEAHIVTGNATAVDNLVKCVEEAGVAVEDLILQPLASGEAVLTENEREMGVMLVDLGGGTTDLALFTEGQIWHTVVLPVGGNHVTNDIAIGLQMPFNAAEELKIRYGYALADEVDNTPLDITTFGDEGHQTVSRRLLAEIIEARVEEIFELVLQEIKRVGYEGLLPAGVVLCGGTAELAGIRQLARQVLNMPVRIGTPHDLQGLVDVLSSPAYATSVGLLLWSQRSDFKPRPPQGGHGLGTIYRKLLHWLRTFLPD